MSEALNFFLIEACKRLDASYDPPVTHSIDEVRPDIKLIKSINQKKRKPERYSRCGLVNLGASCFLNAVLLCLLSCPLPLPQKPEENSFMPMFCNLALEMRQQTGHSNASNIYYALSAQFRPGQLAPTHHRQNLCGD